MNRRASPLLPLLLLVPTACQKAADPAPAAAAGPADPDRITLTPAQRDRLGITLEDVRPVGEVPVATVPGVVSLPPEARVAVTSPFGGTVTQVLVIPGQPVRKGEALATVHAAEAVQVGAALARAQAELPVASASAARLGQLAHEGIIAPARADEARAALRALQATVSENRRLLALGAATGAGTITLRAPIAGRVAAVGVEAGGAVGPAAGAAPAPFVVENTAALRLDLQVPERLAGRVRAGLPVSVGLDGRSVRGTVLSVGLSLDPQTRALPARASLPAGTLLVPGTGVQATVTAPTPAGTPAFAVPATAVTHDDSGDQVFVAEGAGFRRVRVRVAGELDGRTIVSGPLRPGARVASSAVAELKAIGQER